ncbi:hypothetical protein [Acidithiobacillus caldus]|jgi:hypothetical protein|nr:hypothetical protein [Acidithiobacillus caldus]MBU2731178.1 hypothetical protein [Acidithiobacillus caldus]MBU2734419.1 hypothetical protein [Acidithiobacillus caldus ATCC 51756]MBU2745389.1 hypothetical protein [Acidithiobacillus caldus]MBU2779156.1 hypothetical protein [Acidithiobacillus caldus]MBU2782643.1 hypothetical protein [Acidithiobacillus caldus]
MIEIIPDPDTPEDSQAWAKPFRFGVCRNALAHRIKEYSMPWPEFVSKLQAPVIVADKKQSRAIVPATFSTAYAKNEHVTGLTAMVLDIEQHGDGPQPMPVDDADEYLAETGLSFALWSTFSNRPKTPRYRVLFPLDGVLPPHNVKRAYGLLTASLETFAGVVDTSCFHAARLFFLPCVSPGREGEYTMHANVYGEWLRADRLAEAVQAIEDDERRQAEAKRQRVNPREYNGNSVIQSFNEQADIAQLLEQAGYRRRGKKWLSPSSHSGIPGIVQFEGGRVFCHHTSDPLYDPHGVDAFEVFARLWHGGDRRKAVAALRREVAA